MSKHWPWLSLDLAGLSGFTQWIGPTPVAVGHIRPRGELGKYVLSYSAVPKGGPRPLATSTDEGRGELVFDFLGPGQPLPFVQAWSEVFRFRPRVVVVERPHGKFRKADAALAEIRGVVKALAGLGGARLEQLNTGTWRRAATEAWGCTWLSEGDSERLKAQSVALVREHFKWEVAIHDEAEAMLVGAGALRTRLIDLTTDGWGLPQSDAAKAAERDRVKAEKAAAREREREAKRAAKAAEKQHKRGAKGSPLPLVPEVAGTPPAGSL